MFGKLKARLKNWTKSLSKNKEKEEKEPQKTEELEVPINEEIPEKKEPKKKKLIQKPPKEEKTETITELIETPKEFNAGIQGYEPDLEKIQEIEKELEEKTKEPKKISKPEEKKSFFGKITSKVNKVKISEKEFWDYAGDLETLLLENNVAFEVSEKIIEKLKEKIVDKEFLKKEVEFQITESLKDIIYEILVEPFDLVEKIKLHKGENSGKPYIILFCGINGTGKTTSIAKIANLLKNNKLSSVFAAGDTFRAASIEQIKKHGENLGINTISHEYGSDPASVGFDAIKYAEKSNIDVVLIDTAGRMHTEKNLMSQIEKVSRVCNPDLKIFVGESITGNDIVEQVKAFDKSIGIDGIILSKADIDDKGGTALSVGYTTNKPILFLGTGQGMEDLEKFDRHKFVEKLGLDSD